MNKMTKDFNNDTSINNFSKALGYDDFPTEIKFTVSLEHCMPRENSMIENMFNAGKGRIYAFTDENILSAYKMHKPELKEVYNE